MAGQGVAREMQAVYKAGGVRAELDATLPLATGERVITEGMVRRYANAFVQRPCYVRLTPVRLGVVEHFLARSDRVTEVPPDAVEEVEQDGELVLVAWRTAGGRRAVRFQPRSWLFPVRHKLPESAAELTVKLRSWRQGR